MTNSTYAALPAPLAVETGAGAAQKSRFSKVGRMTVAALFLGAVGVAALPGTAEAQHFGGGGFRGGYHGGGGYRGGYRGGYGYRGFIPGIGLGLLAGAAVASAYPYGYAYPYPYQYGYAYPGYYGYPYRPY